MLVDARTRDWGLFFGRLEQQGRATVGQLDGVEYAIAAERREWVRLLWPEMTFTHELAAPGEKKELVREEVLRKIALGWLGILGPVTARSLGEQIGLPASEIWKAMLMLEASGAILRGVFEGSATATVTDEEVEWCERRLLQRIHKGTLGALRKQIEPVTPAVYMRWLLQWQHLAPQAQLGGEHGVLEAIRGLEGFEAPAAEWERSLLPQRVAGYDPRWLDALCMAGVVGWGRLSPHPCFGSVETGGSKSSARRIVPTSLAPVTFFVREEALWMDLCLQQRQIASTVLDVCLSGLAGKLRSFLGERGAMFSGDLARSFAVPAAELQRALWELVAAGLVTADGFDSLRILIDPKRNGGQKPRGKLGHAAGRWSLLCGDGLATSPAQREAQLESACTVLLRRYGVVFRDLLTREETTCSVARLGAGNLSGGWKRAASSRGGRFLSGFGGEQFALPEAVESLREMRRRPDSSDEVIVAAADPMNLVGIVVPGDRVAAVPGRTVTFVNGFVAGDSACRMAQMMPAPVVLGEGSLLGNCSLRLTAS